MGRVHLSPRLYNSLQNLAHRGHYGTFEVLKQLLQVRPGDRVLEVGCGTGVLANHFVREGYDYWGIDLDSERIAAARQQAPKANFVTCDALALESAGLPRFQHVFIHGVLHHLGDSETRHLLQGILSNDSNLVLVVIEPFRPLRWWTNPLGELFGRMDEGRFVRTLEGWRTLFEPNAEVLTTRSRWPPWPVATVVARLVTEPQKKETASALLDRLVVTTETAGKL